MVGSDWYLVLLTGKFVDPIYALANDFHMHTPLPQEKIKEKNLQKSASIHSLPYECTKI